MLAKIDSIQGYTSIKAQVYILTKEERGIRGNVSPILTNDKFNFFFRTNDVSGTIKLPNEITKILPGTITEVTIILDYSMALEIGTRFSIRNADTGSVIGAGIVTNTV